MDNKNINEYSDISNKPDSNLKSDSFLTKKGLKQLVIIAEEITDTTDIVDEVNKALDGILFEDKTACMLLLRSSTNG
jgi:hypothetical protein